MAYTTIALLILFIVCLFISFQLGKVHTIKKMSKLTFTDKEKAQQKK